MLIPSFETPDGRPEGEYLRTLAEEGLRLRYGDPVPAEARERLEMELGVIGKMGFDAYFLIVWDFVRYAKENGIAVGPGRGSAAGSIVSYALAITDIDPLAYGLLFERFLNAERVSMPDIDIDFSVKGRDRVIQYVADKYGRECVAQIITFGRMFPRAASRDAARVLGFDYATGDRIAKLIPEPVMGRSKSFDEYLREEPELRRVYDTEQEARQVVETAKGLEGIVRNSSIHAAAVVIADRPLTDIVPLQLAEDRGAASVAETGERSFRTVTQYPMKPIEEIGLLKMDFLGLRNLDVIEAALDIIEESTGARPDMTTLPLDDQPTYNMLQRGDSIGVFQFESEGMRDALRKVKPTEFNDLVALNALYRPGAMRYIDVYARNKRSPEGISYIDERLRKITESTYGVILYQEQSMEIAKTLAGFSGPEADDLRKAIGKKLREAMAALKDRFIQGARGTGTSDRVIQELWSVNESAADYSFNRSHAACYGLISYRTAWLKANYPAEYMAALISSVMSTKDKVPFFVSRCEDMGIKVLPPDVNESGHDFKVVEGNIRFGLDAVKNVGAQAVDAIVAARDEAGPFASIWDFCRRVDCRAVNKKATESLVKCGALDSLGASRTGTMQILQQALGAGQQAQQDAIVGQGSFFELEGGDQSQSRPPRSARAAARGRQGGAERLGEGDARAVSLEPSPEGGAAGAAREGRVLARRAGRQEGRRLGHRRRHDRRVQAHPHAQGRPDDVRHPRRPGGPGRAARVQLRLRQERAAGRRRQDRDRARPRRHQGAGRGQARRAGGRAVRAEPRGSRARGRRGAGRAAREKGHVARRPGRPDSFLEELREIVGHHPGDHELLLAVGARRLVLGPDYRVSANSACQSELSALHGASRVVA